MRWLFKWFSSPPPQPSVVPKGKSKTLYIALSKARQNTVERKRFPIKPPDLPPGVVPTGKKAAIAMDSGSNASVYQYAAAYRGDGAEGFPGYPYLAALATRAEYRAFASTLATELTREWITINSTETADDSSKQKITEITQELTRLGLQNVIKEIAAHDSYFGRGQIFVDIAGQDRSKPLILSEKTVKKDSVRSIKAVEPMWITPSSYNALDPAAPDFYVPSRYFMLGREVHASRLLIVITRPVPDLFKPAFNFSGMSMSQLAEPYVDNWLRTRQAVSDLINNFSIVNLKTKMGDVLQGGDEEGPEHDGTTLFQRVDLFEAGRSNKGVMLTDKETEELEVLSSPLGGLSELQAQAQEHMCSVSTQPAIKLTGISPSGLNASSDGEIRVWHERVSALQESDYRQPIEIVLKLAQLNLYGVIDPDITFTFNPLYQMTDAELAKIRADDAQAAGVYIDRGVIAPDEERERLARDTESGYQGLDLSREIEIENENPEGEGDDE